MSQSAYDELMGIRNKQAQSFSDWMTQEGLTTDDEHMLVDKEGNRYYTDVDYRNGKVYKAKE